MEPKRLGTDLVWNAEKLDALPKTVKYGVFVYVENDRSTECIFQKYAKTKKEAMEIAKMVAKRNYDAESNEWIYLEVWQRPADDLWGNVGSPIYDYVIQ